jgi:hypothetical protein
MKSKALLFIPIASFLLLIYGFGGNVKWPGGSPGGYTGSPGDGKDCTNCHGGNASQVVGWINSDIPPEGYIPGETYTISLSVPGTGDKGFEVSPQDLQGNLIGSLIDGPGIHLVAGNTAVTQDDATSANPAQWQFDWIAPEAGTGDVTFYGAFTVNKPVTRLSTFIIQENAGVKITEHAEQLVNIFPNPTSENIHIKYRTGKAGALAIDLISMNGTMIRIVEEMITSAGVYTFDHELSPSIQAGIYIVRISSPAGSENHRLVVR